MTRHLPAATYRLTAPCGRALATLTRQGDAFVPLGTESPTDLLLAHTRRCFACRGVPGTSAGNCTEEVGNALPTLGDRAEGRS